MEQSEEFGPFVVSECVFVEVCWVLESVYSIRRLDISRMLSEALESRQLVPWDAATAACALDLMQTNQKLSAVDAVLAATAAQGDAVFTLDRELARTIENL
jgi:predicted nucleic acid-binding protein